ncbi:phage virion morphogenesis protein [Pseudoalteromonas sp. Isolate6]|uniref:phage virion morphogenesis protein n=1 Tax=Pseudoalteromonas sp. Isolate6 TaxID=2908527 RepID=UPI001EFC6E69|nr:phage virion morphogenesis protein [Pseudoalteromonas sp. Isolate6]MCG9761650.1 phage virion morphogenesis protein [Pseudoalteromonas sp. Isolate6]
MTTRIEILTSGDATKVLNEIAARFNDLSEPMNEIAAIMEGATEDAFAEERSPVTGIAWPALSENYLKKTPKRVGGQMLQVSAGGLASSIAADSGAFWAQISSNKPYAAIQNLGGLPEMAPGPAAIPQREYLGISLNEETNILDTLSNYFTEN